MTPTPKAEAPGPNPAGDREGRSTFRRNLFRVLLVQGVALLLLWLLQSRYTG